MNMKEKNWYVVEEYAFNKSDEQCYKYSSKEAAIKAMKIHFFDNLKIFKEIGAKLRDFNIESTQSVAYYEDGRFKIYVAEM